MHIGEANIRRHLPHYLHNFQLSNAMKKIKWRQLCFYTWLSNRCNHWKWQHKHQSDKSAFSCSTVRSLQHFRVSFKNLKKKYVHVCVLLTHINRRTTSMFWFTRQNESLSIYFPPKSTGMNRRVLRGCQILNIKALAVQCHFSPLLRNLRTVGSERLHTAKRTH